MIEVDRDALRQVAEDDTWAEFGGDTILALLDALASRDARLAAVEALAHEWDAAETHPVGFNMTCWEASRRLRAVINGLGASHPITEEKPCSGT